MERHVIPIWELQIFTTGKGLRTRFYSLVTIYRQSGVRFQNKIEFRVFSLFEHSGAERVIRKRIPHPNREAFYMPDGAYYDDDAMVSRTVQVNGRCVREWLGVDDTNKLYWMRMLGGDQAILYPADGIENQIKNINIVLYDISKFQTAKSKR